MLTLPFVLPSKPIQHEVLSQKNKQKTNPTMQTPKSRNQNKVTS